jgi:hypothetical protein
MLEIPSASASPNAEGALAELAAAVEGRRPGPLPPPPEPDEDEDLDDFQLPDLQVSSARETDIFPAIGLERVDEAASSSSVRPRSRPEAPVVSAPPTALPEHQVSGWNIAAIVLLTVVVLGGVVFVAWMALR